MSIFSRIFPKYISRPPLLLLLLLLGNLCIGTGICLVMPPWEGLDETAHYSYIQQLHDTHIRPDRDTGMLSSSIYDYASHGPMPYSHTYVKHLAGVSVLRYDSLFAHSEESLFAVRNYLKSTSRIGQRFFPGPDGNWESQHPVLYYALMLPVYSIVGKWPWAYQILALRIASFLMAWVGLVVGALVCLRRTKPPRVAAIASLFITAWVFLFPSWTMDVVRVGNDCLCVLLSSLCFALLVPQKPSLKRYFAAAILLAAGLLTKAFFLGIAGGIVFFLAAESFQYHRQKLPQWWKGIAGASIIILVCLGIAGPSYLQNVHETGSVVGAGVDQSARQGAVNIVGTLSSIASLRGIAKAHLGMLSSAITPGSWSLARPPHVLRAPFVMLAVLLFGMMLYRFRALLRGRLFILSFCVSVPMIAGLYYHLILFSAIHGQWQGTGGEYLNCIAVPLAVLIALTVDAVKRVLLRGTFFALVSYSLLFVIVFFWLQMMLFSGICAPTPDQHFFHFFHGIPPLLGVPLAFRRLDVLSFPYVGVPLFVIGAALSLFAWWRGRDIVVKGAGFDIQGPVG
jgi:hypothetical protein